MKILQIHNYYQIPGGEDRVVRAERELLTGAGHEVVTFTRHNDEIRDYGLLRKMELGLHVTWSRSMYRELREQIERERPDVAHFHNTFPLLSPSLFHACSDAGVPVVRTLHNFRLICPSAVLYRDGAVCEDCVGRTPWPSVVHGCYRASRANSAAVTAMLMAHRAMGTYDCKTDVYIVLSEFARRKLCANGLPERKVVVLPNFVHAVDVTREGGGEYALFVGRLSVEKGLDTLLEAWKRLPQPVPLRIVGDGPLYDELQAETAKAGLASVTFTGRLSRQETMQQMKGARFLLTPSRWYECSPVTIIEAFACGLPVICSAIGSLGEMVEDGRTGLHFTVADANALAERVAWAWEHAEEMRAMGMRARDRYEGHYAPDRHYDALLRVYRRALASQSMRVLPTVAVERKARIARSDA